MSDADLAQAREYARHARSMSARRRRQRAFVLALVGCVVAAATVIAAPTAVRMLIRTRPDPSLRAAAAVREAAVSWITQWVGNSAMISCDPNMCSDLQEHGIPSSRLVPLGVNAPDPEGSDVVVATLAIRKRFGSKLAHAYAPAVLASFGAGNARIDVRVVPWIGTAANYLRALRTDQRRRRTASTELLRNPNVTETRAAAAALAKGRVDSRILATLAALARICPLYILGFGGAAPDATKGMPLLSIDLAVGGPARNSAAGAADAGVAAPKLEKVIAFLHAQIQPLRPDRFRELTSRSGLEYVRIDYGAPTVMVFNGSA